MGWHPQVQLTPSSLLNAYLQAVRKHGSGYYLVLHAVNPNAGRQDFMTWIMNKQKEAVLTSMATSNNLVAAPSPLLLLQATHTGASVTTAARRAHNAMALRSISKDLGTSFSVIPRRQGSHAVGAQGSALQPSPPPPMAHLLLDGISNPAMANGIPARQGSGDNATPEDPLEEVVLSKVSQVSASN
jgi:hypothetical protein